MKCDICGKTREEVGTPLLEVEEYPQTVVCDECLPKWEARQEAAMVQELFNRGYLVTKVRS